MEQVGSAAVVGLLAKPIMDLAVGLALDQEVVTIRRRLESDAWIYRGDAAGDGGHVFVLETRPWFRVAHLHVVAHVGRQWRDYLLLRDLLRHSPEARDRFEAVELRLLQNSGNDRRAYTVG